MEQILQATVHNFCLWGAKERLLPIRWWTAAAAAFWVVRELRSARYIIMFSGNRKSRLLTYENSPMGYFPSIYTEKTSVRTFLYQIMCSESYLSSVISSHKIKTCSTLCSPCLLEVIGTLKMFLFSGTESW